MVAMLHKRDLESAALAAAGRDRDQVQQAQPEACLRHPAPAGSELAGSHMSKSRYQ